jgi:hypothetical protein
LPQAAVIRRYPLFFPLQLALSLSVYLQLLFEHVGKEKISIYLAFGFMLWPFLDTKHF